MTTNSVDGFPGVRPESLGISFSDFLLDVSLNTASGAAFANDETFMGAQRRAGHKRVQGQQSDDISTEAEEGSAESEDNTEVASISTAVVSTVSRRLDNAEGRATLATDIDGKTNSERSMSEQIAIGNALNRLDGLDGLGIRVQTVAPGETETVTTNTGAVVEVNLAAGEDSQIQTTASGETILVLATDLSTEQVIETTISAVADVIEQVAENAGVDVVESLEAALFEESFEVFMAWRDHNALIYGDFLMRSIDI